MKRRAAALMGTIPLCLALATSAHAAGINDNFADATTISAMPFVEATTNQGATTETNEPRPCGAIGSTLWYRFTAESSSRAIADTFGSTFDTVLAVYSGTSPFNLTLLRCNDDSSGVQSKVSFQLTAGRTYYIQAGGYGGAQGPLVVSLARAGAIAGTVADAEGTPLPNVCVDTYDADRVLQETGYTDQSGRYTVTGLASGEYRVRFADCGSYGDEPSSTLYATEWYADKVSFSAADPVLVTKGETTQGIDAVLAPRPRPDLAITTLSFEDVKIRTSAGDLPVGIGTAKRVTVEITNLGGATPRWSRISVDACPNTMGSCRTIGDARITVKPGTTVTKTFTWSAADWVGDVTVTALANTSEDADWTNNSETADQFVHVGGLGLGVGPRCTRTYNPIYLPLFCEY